METLLQQLTRGKALLLLITLGIGGQFQLGYHSTGLSSPSPYIQDFINSSWCDRYKEPPPPQMVTMIWSLIVSLYPLGGLLGAVSVKFISGFLGRKKGMIGSSCVAIVAAAVMLMSDTVKSYEMILLARILWGFSVGLGSSFHLMYLAEISPKAIRGRVTLTSANFVALGKFSGQLFGLQEILGRKELWSFVLSVPACLSLIQIMVLPFLPESPRYLFIEKGDEKACRNALQSLWGPGDYKQEIDEMMIEQATIEAAPPKSPLQLLVDKNVRWQLLTMCLIYWFNQLSGMTAISIFSFDILLESGIPEDQIRYVTLGLGVCEIITSMSSSLLIERIGRRPLFWAGYGSMFSYWVLISILLNVKISSSSVSYVTAGLIVLIIVSFCGGPGSATGTLSSEIFMQSDRAVAFAITGFHRWFAMALMGFSFPFLISYLQSYSFVLFAFVCLLGCLYNFFILPETKGKTVLEIIQEFSAITVCGQSSPQDETKL